MGVGRLGGGGSGDIDGAIAAHEAKSNPHPVYLTETEADALYDPIGSAAAALDRANHTGTQAPSTIDGGGDGLAVFVSSLLTRQGEWGWNNTLKGFSTGVTLAPNNANGTFNWNFFGATLTPLQNSPNDVYNLITLGVEIDPSDSGFNFGTSGQAVNAYNTFINYSGSGDLGRVNFHNSSGQFGNGTDPVDISAIQYAGAFFTVSSGVTITGNLQGYIFNPTLQSGSAFGPSAFANAFADFSNVQTQIRGYTSFSASPNIESVAPGSNYNAFTGGGTITTLPSTSGLTSVGLFTNITTVENNAFVQGVISSHNITTMQGNSGYTGFGCFPQIGSTGAGSFHQGIGLSPTITLNRGNYVGVSSSVSNITNFAGVESELVIQDIVYTFLAVGDNNAWQIEYTDTATAGSETVNISGQLITIGIESGVSTANQILAALALNFQFSSAIDAQISGVGTNPQVVVGPTNFQFGENPGTARAGQFDGDVQINGNLGFTGSITLGETDAFAAYAIVNGTGTPASTHTLITAPGLAASQTRTNVDYLGVNTAMLLTVGAGSTVGTGFLGIHALGLPAVVNLGAGATVGRVGGSIFAISLEPTAGGGTINEVHLCSAVAIPNGVTTVNTLRAYFFDQPFGPVGTTIYGLYSAPASAINYVAGSLVVGSTDTPANSSVGIEITGTTKALLLPRMTSTERNALTAVDGMLIYNTTSNHAQVYAGGTWQNLH